MVKFHGAIDYIILKNNKQYFIFFLDNHNPHKYCSIPAQNIDSLFQYFINNDPNTTFIFEELLNNTKSISLFPNTPHLKKYLEFYNQSTIQSYPIDIRINFDNTNLPNIFHNFDILFLNLNNQSDIIINNIKIQIEMACKKSSKYLEHFIHLKTHYEIIKRTLNDNEELLNKIKTNSYLSPEIDIDYPWLNNTIKPTINNICDLWEQFNSALLELYAISFIILSNSKTTISYLGACHCLVIFNILEKYYNYRNIRKFKNYDLTKINKFNLYDLQTINNSCIDFSNN